MSEGKIYNLPQSTDVFGVYNWIFYFSELLKDCIWSKCNLLTVLRDTFKVWKSSPYTKSSVNELFTNLNTSFIVALCNLIVKIISRWS